MKDFFGNVSGCSILCFSGFVRIRHEETRRLQLNFYKGLEAKKI